MTEPDRPQTTPDQIEPAKRAWVEPELEVLPVDDTSVAPFGHPEEGGTGSS
jgi:hypothetical protein